MFFLLHYGQYNVIKGKQELILQWSNFWCSEIMETAQAVESYLPQMMEMDSQWNARYRLQFLVSDHLRILSCIKWQWNLHILYELPFIFHVKTWQSEFYHYTNTKITVCLYKIYNHLADVITVCRSPWNGDLVRYRNYPRRRCELLNATLKYSFTVFILQKN